MFEIRFFKKNGQIKILNLLCAMLTVERRKKEEENNSTKN